MRVNEGSFLLVASLVYVVALIHWSFYASSTQGHDLLLMAAGATLFGAGLIHVTTKGGK